MDPSDRPGPDRNRPIRTHAHRKELVFISAKPQLTRAPGPAAELQGEGLGRQVPGSTPSGWAWRRRGSEAIAASPA